MTKVNEELGKMDVFVTEEVSFQKIKEAGFKYDVINEVTLFFNTRRIEAYKDNSPYVLIYSLYLEKEKDKGVLYVGYIVVVKKETYKRPENMAQLDLLFTEKGENFDTIDEAISFYSHEPDVKHDDGDLVEE